METFDPNQIGIPNGNYFAFPYRLEEADLVLVSVPWDVTTSYRDGASKGPLAILEASPQLDFFDYDVKEAWKLKIATLPLDPKILDQNKIYRLKAATLIKQMEAEQPLDHSLLQEVNQASLDLNDYVYNTCKSYLQQGKKVGLIGGDHSTPYGYLQALSEVHEHFGVLHIDAHADLRIAYEGFAFSHASIMYQVSQLESVKSLVQVGIRDVSDDEVKYAERHEGISQFSDHYLKTAAFCGRTWNQLSDEIIAKLPAKVYVSFDIDGLSPDLCPNTGTPVPGGLSFSEATYLLTKIRAAGKEIIGFDLCEVAPGNDEWDANVGARILYKLAILTLTAELQTLND